MYQRNTISDHQPLLVNIGIWISNPNVDEKPDSNDAECVEMISRAELFFALVYKFEPIGRLHHLCQIKQYLNVASSLPPRWRFIYGFYVWKKSFYSSVIIFDLCDWYMNYKLSVPYIFFFASTLITVRNSICQLTKNLVLCLKSSYFI